MLQRWSSLSATKRDPARKLVWFHAPSVGEGLQARPVIDLLRAQHPEVQIAYSFFSPSAKNFAASLDVDMAEYLPFDSASAAEQMVTMLGPSALFFSKLDVWPNLVRIAHNRGVPTGLLSATIAASSGRQGRVARAFLHDAYQLLDIVGAIDDANANRLIQLGVQRNRMHISGDTRFDQAWARAHSGGEQHGALLQSLQSTRPTLVAGSTWPADEAVLLPAWLDVKRRASHARLIIAPHEPTAAHTDAIERWANQHKFAVARLSVLATAPNVNPADVIVVDSVGVLGYLYAVADVAFVGGAFHSAGLHSVLEPAAYGVPVVFGPSYHRAREAGLLLAAGGAMSVSTVHECGEVLTSFLTDGARREAAGSAAELFVRSELGAAERSLQLVARALNL